jgi:ATP/maltotriose-dependent transcriptional regulator MalT
MENYTVFERKVAKYYQELGIKTVIHDKEVGGQQIDVYLEEETLTGNVFRTAIEVKLHSKPLGIRFIRKSAEIYKFLKDNGLIDCYVLLSSCGFTKPGRKAAEAANIKLFDWADNDRSQKEKKEGVNRAPTVSELLQYREIITNTIPPLAPSTINRPDLIKIFSRSCTVKTTFVIGPAGYGKTQITASFYQKNRNTSLWYTINESDSEVNNLFQSLCIALNHVLLKQKVATEDFLHTFSEARDPDRLMAAYICILLDNLDKQKDYYLILDDAYKIKTDSSSYYFICETISLLPSNVHIIIVLREGDKHAYNRKNIPHLLINSGDLRFDKDEIVEVLGKSLVISSTDINYLFKITEGWPLAVALTADIVASGQANSVRDLISGRGGPGLANYLFQISFEKLSVYSQKLLVLAAICPRFHYDIAIEVLEDTVNPSQMDEVLKIYNSATIRLENGWLRLHDLLRAFLIKSVSQKNPELLKKLQIKAAHFFANNDQNFVAFELYFKAKDQEKSAIIFEKIAEGLRHRSLLLQQNEWIDSLPDNLISNSPWLCLCKGRLLEFRGRFQQAFELVNRSLKNFKIIRDHRGIMVSLYQLGKLCQQNHQEGSSLKYLKEAASIAANLGEMKMELFIKTKIAALGRLIGKDEKQEAIDNLYSLKDYIDRPEFLTISAALHHVLGNCLRDIGEYKSSIEEYDKSINVKTKLDDLYGIAKTLRNQAISYQHIGDFKKAESQLNESIRIQEEIEDLPGIPRTLDSLGYCYLQQGRPDETIMVLNKALRARSSLEKEDLYGIGKTNLMIAEAYTAILEMNNAQKHLKIFLNLFGGGGSLWLQEMALRVSGSIKTMNSDLKNAINDFKKSIVIGKKLNIKHRTDESIYKVASIMAAQGKFKDAYKILNDNLLADNDNQNNFTVLQKVLFLKLNTLRGHIKKGNEYYSDFKHFNFKNNPYLEGVREELLGDIKRFEWDINSAERYYLTALDYYKNAGRKFRIHIITTKLKQISSDLSHETPISAFPQSLSVTELMWVVY